MGDDETVIDFARPEPQPVPVTTIAWRIDHLLVGVFGERNARYFGGPPVSYATTTTRWTPRPPWSDSTRATRSGLPVSADWIAETLSQTLSGAGIRERLDGRRWCCTSTAS